MLLELGRTFFNPVSVSWHYLSMARNKLAEVCKSEQTKIKHYFYILRPLACVRFMWECEKIPHMEYRRNLESIFVPDAVRAEINSLLTRKEQGKHLN